MRYFAMSGRPVSEITIESAVGEELTAADLRIHPDTLRHQAGVAESDGNAQLADNFRRAAELASLEDADLLRSTRLSGPGVQRSAARSDRVASRQLERTLLRGPREGGRGRLRTTRAACMTLVAGIDVGNTTTEIVLAEVKRSTVEPLRSGRAFTVGGKGSDASLQAAARLLDRLESALGSRSDTVAIAALNPVSTNLAELPASATRGRTGPKAGFWAGCNTVRQRFRVRLTRVNRSAQRTNATR